MRRLDDGHAQRPPPFRVLAAPDGNFLSPNAIPPPPPRAPEPYKIAPSSTSSSRAHRRSSFVIIADSRPASPEVRSPSPALAAGRVSPFRGRGFKGAPPRSKSRAQSPENGLPRTRGRNDRRVSVSQHSSPRRSLIPQPTRQRSTSLGKSAERLGSPRLGRRADSRVRLNPTTDSRNRSNATGTGNGTANLAARRQPTKTPGKLSPIRGTPSKPERTPQLARRDDRSKESTTLSPSKRQKFAATPAKNAWNAKKPNQEKIPSTSGKASRKERLGSPSKIPLKTNRVSSNASNPARFITVYDQPSDKAKRAVDKGSEEARIDKERTRETEQGGEESETGSKGASRQAEQSSGNDRVGDLDLIDLLKQTSNATGTSSVVNTTAKTAVQPLHIDANAILLDKDSSDRRNRSDRTRSEQDLPNGKSSNASNDDSVDERQTQSQNARTVKSGKANGNCDRTKAGTETRNDSPVPADASGSHARNNGIGQSTKGLIGKVNGTPTGTDSATQRPSKSQTARNEENAKNSGQNDRRDEESSTVRQTVSSASSSVKINENEPTNESGKSSSSAEGQRTMAPNAATVSTKQENAKTGSRIANETETGSAASATSARKTRTADQTKTISKAKNASTAVGAVSNDAKNVKTRTDNRGSGTSLKSSAGLSDDSIESVRSTDTGVSVNTVKGVSSPREKTGVHVVKRAQEIETLSGNVVHLEQNGEPTVLAAANGVGERPPDKFFTRWRNRFSRCWQGCSRMRCLACRTDAKGLAWPGKHAKATAMVNRNEPPPVRDVAPGCWTKFKNRCRCKRPSLPKCCSKRSRVAPAEASACCPPERRFAAVCRRLFDRCKCRRDSDADRARNIRAKHSLTSVAPPPLSEEPKAKIPDVLVEHNSLMRGAIPCLPVPLAWFCLVWNVLLPGSGTVWSGIFNLCTGQPRFSPVAGPKSRLGAFVVNLMVGAGQLFTVLFCLVGWGWSIWWGVTLVRLARKYKRFKASEAANNDPEARGGEPSSLPPGVPSQALRGMEPAR